MPDQRSVLDQLQAVMQLANKAGHYDAADWIRTRLEAEEEARKRRLLQERKTLSSKDALKMIVSEMNPRQQHLLTQITSDWQVMRMSVHRDDLFYFERLGLVELREVPTRHPMIKQTEGRLKP